MKYFIETWTVRELVDAYNNDRINLNPPYQRNDIWSLPAKKRLLETIIKGYPLPTFFLHRKKNEKFDCVDGQQRIRTIIGFINKMFPTFENEYFGEMNDSSQIETYRIPIIIIEDVNEDREESMEDFYYRVNMYGSKLNRPEILKSKYFNNPLQNLIERISESSNFINLSLFTDSRLSRMNDYDFIGELVTILKEGIFDKKIAVDRLYEDDTFTENVAEEYEVRFNEVLKIFLALNTNIYPLKETRYKQRNDFYTLFHFIQLHLDISLETLKYFYRLLVFFESDILPSNEKCYAFQEYAFNCISQSNSKKAREERFKIISDILLNRDPKPIERENFKDANMNLIDVLQFYSLTDNDLIKLDNFYLIDIRKFESIKPDLKFIS